MSENLNSKPMCLTHKPGHLAMGYREWMERGRERIAAGEKQIRCKVCKFWFFKDELGPLDQNGRPADTGGV